MTEVQAFVVIAVFVLGFLIGEAHGFSTARSTATKLIHSQLLFIHLVYEELSAAYPQGDAALREKVKEVLPEFEVVLEHPSVARQLEEAKRAVRSHI